MRLFFAIKIPESVRKEIINFTNKFSEFCFVKSENYHITLKFIGEVKNENDLIKAVSNINFKKFKVQLNGVGTFPNVLWIGIQKGSNEVIKLAGIINKNTQDFKKEDYEFHPHVTISRDKKLVEKNILKESFISSEFEVNSFKLKQSILKKNSVEYKTVKSFSLI